ncbi:MAG: hypothetical protein GY926_05825 [bacterium]|nr:hypothetical protein [bacterium]
MAKARPRARGDGLTRSYVLERREAVRFYVDPMSGLRRIPVIPAEGRHL